MSIITIIILRIINTLFITTNTVMIVDLISMYWKTTVVIQMQMFALEVDSSADLRSELGRILMMRF